MMASRRAARPAPRASAVVLGGTLVALGTALAAAAGAVGAVSVGVARRVVRPAGREADTRLVRLDTSAQTITLGRTADTELPGRYGLFTVGTATYLKIGSVVSEDAGTVTRKLLTEVPAGSSLAAEAAFSGWYFDRPDQLHVPYANVQIGTPLGPCPAWLFPRGEADDTGDLWVIQVHGRGTTRSECLRSVPLFRSLGYTTLIVSYRNDGEAPRSRSGTYALGADEWSDVDAAIAYAKRRGARRIVLMGWSMGGAIALQVALQVALQHEHADDIAAIVLDSPVIDWRVVLDFHARMLHLPAAVRDLAIGTLRTGWASGLARTGPPIPFDRLDVVARAGELRHPILVLHSDDDGFVPSDASHDLARRRPDLVQLEVFEVARHTKLWNYDEHRWSRAITAFLRERGLVSAAAADAGS